MFPRVRKRTFASMLIEMLIGNQKFRNSYISYRITKFIVFYFNKIIPYVHKINNYKNGHLQIISEKASQKRIHSVWQNLYMHIHKYIEWQLGVMAGYQTYISSYFGELLETRSSMLWCVMIMPVNKPQPTMTLTLKSNDSNIIHLFLHTYLEKE